MHFAPHPNQIRSACERCRRQKLRCSRSPAPDAPACARCTRLGLSCLAGSQRRVGRPPKKELVSLRRGPGVTEAVPLPCPDAGAGVVEEIHFMDGLLDDSGPGMEWNMGANSPLSFGSADDMLLSLDALTMPLPKEIPPLPIPPNLNLTHNIHFETLSQLNVEIHKGYSTLSRIAAGLTFEDFVCGEDADMRGYENLQGVIKNTQEFLLVIKTLHRQIGLKPMPRDSNNQPLTTTSLLLRTIDPNLSPSPSEEEPEPPFTHDSPTLFLVVSCFVQLIKHLELVFGLIHTYVANCDMAPGGSAPMAFAGVPVIEAPTQFLLFCELMGHSVSQINIILGLPSPWSGRTRWKGLLKAKRYRDMVNTEFGGAEEGGWSGRPRRLVERSKTIKEMLGESSMIGF